ncbi:MAG: hypothetical protein L0216_15090 [Planctomycetales bacterium]|nr:hypothetical protein [Planctomycetales bacterium]
MRPLALIPVLLAAAPLLAQEPPAPPAAPAGTDFLLLLDVSRSVSRADPGSARVAALRALLDLSGDRAGDRVAVARFAGWAETRKLGAVALPWTELPADPAGQERVLGAAGRALDECARGSARATDWNAASELALAPLLESRGAAPGRAPANGTRPLWVLLLTDGELDPIEGRTVREEYAPAGAAASRADVTAAARARFAQSGLRRFQAPGLLLSTVRVGARVPDPDLLETLAAATAGAEGRVLRLDAAAPGALVRDLVTGLPPGAHPLADSTRLCETEVALAAGTPAEVSVPVLPGDAATRVLAELPAGAGLEVVPAGDPDPLDTARGGRAEVRGSGALRVLLLRGAGTRRTLRLSLPAGAPAGAARVTVWGDLRPDLRVSLPDGPVHSPGGSARVVVELTRGGEALPPGMPFEDLEAAVALLGPDGKELSRQTASLLGESALAATLAIAIPEAAAGASAIEVRVSGFVPVAGGAPAWVSSPARVPFPVRAPVAVSFSPAQALAGQSVAVVAKPRGPRPGADRIAVTVAPEGAPVGGGAARAEVACAWDEKSGAYRGAYSLPSAGTAAVVPGPSGPADVQKGDQPRLIARARRVEVLLLSEAGVAASDPIPLAWGEGGARAKLRLRADLLPGEVGRAVLSVAGVAIPAALAVSLGSGEEAKGGAVPLAPRPAVPSGPLGAAGALGPAEADVTVSLPAESAVEGLLLVVNATLGTSTASAKLALRPPPPKAMGRPVLLAAAAALLVLAGTVFLVWKTTPEFGARHLTFTDPRKKTEHQHFLREFPRRRFGRMAEGTPEANRSIGFRLRGLEGITRVRCEAQALKPYMRVFVNDEEVKGPRALSHGDEVVLRGATLTIRYRYHEWEPGQEAVVVEEVGEETTATPGEGAAIATEMISAPIETATLERDTVSESSPGTIFVHAGGSGRRGKTGRVEKDGVALGPEEFVVMADEDLATLDDGAASAAAGEGAGAASRESAEGGGTLELLAAADAGEGMVETVLPSEDLGGGEGSVEGEGGAEGEGGVRTVIETSEGTAGSPPEGKPKPPAEGETLDWMK